MKVSFMQDEDGCLLNILSMDVWPEAVTNRILSRGEAGLCPSTVEWLADNCIGDYEVYLPVFILFQNDNDAVRFALRFG